MQNRTEEKLRVGKLNPTKKKILFLFLGGAAVLLSCAPSAGRRSRILKIIGKDWRQIKREKLIKEIRQLYRSKLISAKFEKDGSVSLLLSEKGKQKILNYEIDEMKIKRERWDGKWRIVMFDIPEEQKKERDAFRFRLKKLEFREMQKSVFVHPFECRNEIEFFVEFYNIKAYVRFGILSEIDNEIDLKMFFDL